MIFDSDILLYLMIYYYYERIFLYPIFDYFYRIYNYYFLTFYIFNSIDLI